MRDALLAGAVLSWYAGAYLIARRLKRGIHPTNQEES